MGYYFDHRVRAGNMPKWYKRLDEKKMLALFEDADGVEVWVPFEYVVCPTCDGKGSHVNPSIDAHGISGDEFAEDPGFFEDYVNGAYDVPCYECKGKRVVPWANDERVERSIEEDAEYEAMCAAERRMGA